jgi:hypothetical protein
VVLEFELILARQVLYYLSHASSPMKFLSLVNIGKIAFGLEAWIKWKRRQ